MQCFDYPLDTEQLLRISGKFLTDTQRQHDDHRPLLMFLYQSAPFQLLHGLTKAECFKQCPSTTFDSPHYRIPLVRFQCRVDIILPDFKSAYWGNLNLCVEKFVVIHNSLSF